MWIRPHRRMGPTAPGEVTLSCDVAIIGGGITLANNLGHAAGTASARHCSCTVTRNEQNIPSWAPSMTTQSHLDAPPTRRLGVCYSQSLLSGRRSTGFPRERAKPRANAGRHQATPSDARRLSSLVNCPLSDTEPRPATLGT